MARAPETKKATLKKMLADEVSAVLLAHPELKVMKVADGALDNWDFLSSKALPEGEEAIDFFHASEHLHDAQREARRDAVDGDATEEREHRRRPPDERPIAMGWAPQAGALEMCARGVSAPSWSYERLVAMG